MITQVGQRGAVSLWRAGVHHFVAYVLGAACHGCTEEGCECLTWGDDSSVPPIKI
jgi:hypothetical protein